MVTVARSGRNRARGVNAWIIMLSPKINGNIVASGITSERNTMARNAANSANPTQDAPAASMVLTAI